jgi:dTDP-D-glucose 4,6-dehydratase
MKILITGGCGFLGSNLAHHVLQMGKEELFLFDNLCREGSASNLQWLRTFGIFKFYHSDIRIQSDIGNVIREIKPDIIFHVCGQVAMTTSIANTRLDFETNALGTFNLLDAVKTYSQHSIVIYSSSNKVYGDLDWVTYSETLKRYITDDFPNGFSEDTPLDFRSPYGCSKGCADQYMLDFYRIYGIRTVVFRHSSMFGGRQFSTYDQGWIGWFCKQAIDTKNGKLQKPFTISGNGKQVRDVLYADDMVDLYFAAFANIEETKGQAFNIGGGMSNSLSLLELFSILESELDIKLDFVNIPPRQSDQKIFVANITKANKVMDWAPKIEKRMGIKKMLEWMQEK